MIDNSQLPIPMDSLPISGLQHILYCPRQCALIPDSSGCNDSFRFLS